MTPEQKIEAAVSLLDRFGATVGEHHKAWVIDQIARILTGDQYAAFVEAHNADWFGWSTGIAP